MLLSSLSRRVLETDLLAELRAATTVDEIRLAFAQPAAGEAAE
jgi:hypothetical protein